MSAHYVATLVEPASGQTLQICQARLLQSCQTCGMKLHPGEWAVASGERGWSHLDHIERVIATLGPAT